jgi:DNA invertase Pin-like site-specific DNA recombinase
MKYVVYYRKKPGKRALITLPDQRSTVAEFISRNPGTVVSEFIEIDRNRRRPDRIQLRKAIECARENAATLLFACVNRLSRNVEITDMLLKATEAGGFSFIGCDSPTFNHRTIHILSAVAQDNYIKVSERQKTAMAECRAEGKLLGSADPNHWKGIEHKRGWQKAVKEAGRARTEKAESHYQYVLPQIVAYREDGESLDNICWWLNTNGHTTTVGKPFTQTALWRLLKRTYGKKYLGTTASREGITPLQHARIIAELVPAMVAMKEEAPAMSAVGILDKLYESGQTAFLGKGFSREAVAKVAQPYFKGALQVA